MKKPDEYNLDQKIVDEIVDQVVKSLYVAGIITNDDIKDKKSLLLALDRVRKEGLLSGSIVVDHRLGILGQARKFYRNNKYDFSRIFFATFFEHTVNSLIEYYCAQKAITIETQVEIIKNVNIWGKLTWLLELLGLPSFYHEHSKTIKYLADKRNAFIHYKWKPRSDEVNDPEKEKTEIEEEFKKIFKAVSYIQKYESRLKYKGNKRNIEKLI
jgi:hypothetical protein